MEGRENGKVSKRESLIYECILGLGCMFFAIALWGIISKCARQPRRVDRVLVMSTHYRGNFHYYGEKVR